MRRGIVVAALVAHVAAAVPIGAKASSAPLPATVWVAERVSPNAPRFSVDAHYGWNRRGGRVTIVTADLVRGRPRPTWAYTFDSVPDEMPVAYHGGAEYGCLPMSVCDLFSARGMTAFSATVPDDSPQPDRVYLAISGQDVKVALVDSPGWRLTRTRLRTRYALSDHADASGARALGEGVERFGEARLPGGPHGSIAVATPPCRLLHRTGGAREGVGTATLSGGVTTPTFDCRTHLTDLTAAADRPTTWRFAGDVVGVAMGPTRLTVIDL